MEGMNMGNYLNIDCGEIGLRIRSPRINISLGIHSKKQGIQKLTERDKWARGLGGFGNPVNRG